MNYFLHYTLYPALAKYKIIYVYVSSVMGLLLFCFLWLYCIDNQLRKKIVFYDTRLVDIQKKEAEFLKKSNLVKQLIQQKEDLLFNAHNTYQAIHTIWQKGADMLTLRAHAHKLTIDTITITKQAAKDSYQKRTFSLSLQGPVNQIVHFLEDIQEIKYVTLETFSMHIEQKNIGKVTCSYIIQKIKTPSTHNKLKG